MSLILPKFGLTNFGLTFGLTNFGLIYYFVANYYYEYIWSFEALPATNNNDGLHNTNSRRLHLMI